MRINQIRIALDDALRVKRAELWLKLGQTMPAFLELERLPRRARRHPWAAQIYMHTCHTARLHHQLTSQAAAGSARAGIEQAGSSAEAITHLAA